MGQYCNAVAARRQVPSVHYTGLQLWVEVKNILGIRKVSFNHRYRRQNFYLQLLHLVQLFTRKQKSYHVKRWVNDTLT